MPRKARQKFLAPKGTFDILPEDQKYWEKIYKVVKDNALAFGFKKIETPIFEDANLYLATVGEATDIVEKQMYVFKTKGKDMVALRPEGTAGVARAYIENGMMSLPQPVKLYYLGPMFRYEQPQQGRFREFHHAGFEVFGDQDPIYDAEIINLTFRVLSSLGIKNVSIEINSIGCKSCRSGYRTQLLRYYRQRVNKLCSDCKKRAKKSPLRLLDCKEEKCQPFKENAPLLVDNLCDECNAHFKSVLEILDEIEIPYSLNPLLVRGLDYYTKTVFEVFVEDEHLEGGNEKEHKRSKLALGGGGRFDNLVKLIGGQDTPACGSALGLERVIMVMKDQNVKIPELISPKVFLVQVGDLGKRKCLRLYNELVDAHIPTAEALGRRSISSQLKIADKLKVKIALIIGQKEALDGDVIMRDMETGSQELIPIEKIIKTVKDKLKKM